MVDHLYRQLRSEGETRILPLVMDLSDPSPALGWRGRERPSFVDRVRPDLVLCLAVIHHLALSGTVPFPEIVAFLHDFSAPLVVEMPHRDDPMAARLLARKRPGVFDHWLHDPGKIRSRSPARSAASAAWAAVTPEPQYAAAGTPERTPAAANSSRSASASRKRAPSM